MRNKPTSCVAVTVGAALLFSISSFGVSHAQDAPAAGGADAAAAATDAANATHAAAIQQAGQASATSSKPAEQGQTSSDKQKEKPIQSVPFWIVAISSIAALVLNIGTSIAALFVTPRNARRIADQQAEISLKSVGVSEKQAATSLESVEVANKSAQAALANAEAALKNANAVARNAEIAATNSANLGIHAVARLRQDWINDLRLLLAEVHSLLGNHQDPPAGYVEPAEERKSREERKRLANTKVAKIKLLLNPTEVASQNLLDALKNLEKSGDLKQRMRRSRWVIVWGDIILKEEWDRVRAELTGVHKPAPHRRDRKPRSFFSAALRGGRVKSASAARAVAPQSRKRAKPSGPGVP